MLRKSFFTISFLVLLTGVANAYFFSATDGPNLFLFRAERGSNGKLAMTSEFKYAAPGTVGSTALLPVPGSTGTRTTAIIKFDLFATFVNAAGKPTVFRDRVEFDDSSNTFRFVSRKLFPTHKLDSFNNVSAAVSTNPTTRFLLTENGSNVTSRKVNSSGNLTGGSKVIFKNASQVDPLSAALSPDGTFAVQSSFTSSALSSSQSEMGAVGFGVDYIDLADGRRVHLNAGGEPISVTIFIDYVGEVEVGCVPFKEADRGGGRSGRVQGASAADKTGVFLFRFDPNTLQPIGSVTTISRMSSTPLLQHELFNTAFILPDGRDVIFSKYKAGKLESLVQPLNGACGPKAGAPYKLLSSTNPTIVGHPPLKGWAVAQCFVTNLC